MKKKIYILITIIYGAWLYFLYLYTGHMKFDLIIFAFFGMLVTFLLLAAIIGIDRRIEDGVDLLATLETDPEKVKENMLFIMRYGHIKGIKGALEEFNDTFRNYPQWHLQDWEVFRAWYKHEIDHMTEKPAIYQITMSDGSAYSKEKDPLYDPDAPDWEQFDREHYEDDDGEDNNDETPNVKKSASEGFYLGIGLGATDNPLSN